MDRLNIEFIPFCRISHHYLLPWLLDSVTLLPNHPLPLQFHFPNPPPMSPPLLGLHSVEFGYGDQKRLFLDLNFGVDMSSRISIVGPNGVGKSTFLKLLTGEVQPVS